MALARRWRGHPQQPESSTLVRFGPRPASQCISVRLPPSGRPLRVPRARCACPPGQPSQPMGNAVGPSARRRVCGKVQGGRGVAPAPLLSGRAGHCRAPSSRVCRALRQVVNRLAMDGRATPTSNRLRQLAVLLARAGSAAAVVFVVFSGSCGSVWRRRRVLGAVRPLLLSEKLEGPENSFSFRRAVAVRVAPRGPAGCTGWCAAHGGMARTLLAGPRASLWERVTGTSTGAVARATSRCPCAASCGTCATSACRLRPRPRRGSALPGKSARALRCSLYRVSVSETSLRYATPRRSSGSCYPSIFSEAGAADIARGTSAPSHSAMPEPVLGDRSRDGAAVLRAIE